MKNNLPDHLRLRSRQLKDGPIRQDSHFVLYWMRTAQRGHDNPALDVALHYGNQLRIPVLVFQELTSKGPGPYPTARHLAFQLEGALDVHFELQSRNISYGLYLQRAGERESFLPSLLQKAALLVTEDLPTYWFRKETQALLDAPDSPEECFTLAVDTSCIVPQGIVEGQKERAYQFRKVHRPLLQERLTKRWSSLETRVDPINWSALEMEGFELVDLDALREDRELIGSALAAMEIDHSIAVVADTPGGSQAAYQRWRHFRDHHLKNYHHNRNDAARPTQVSRLSAYLHFGQISPFRVASQASALGGEGSEKFLDEMITWREFAHHVGQWQKEKPGVEWLPEWARKTLGEHESDPRPVHYDLETLSRGQTDDELWNLCQISLRACGELHNNLRMTWGKKFLEWSPTVKEAIDRAIELNDRFALDGGDPNSYLGLLWCFGGFDRPFEPGSKIFGNVRTRSTDHHARRLDRETYKEWITRSPSEGVQIAILGAGISAAAAARVLLDHNVDPIIFEKARGPGGRASTRRHEDLRFDHGAQYFTARSASFRHYLEAWQEKELIAPYEPRLGVFTEDGYSEKEADSTERFVALPGMNAIAATFLQEANTHYGHRLLAIKEGAAPGTLGLRFATEEGEQNLEVEALLLTAPAPQTAALLQEFDVDLAEAVREVSFLPTWAVMVAFETSLGLPFEGAFVNYGPLSWIAKNSAKEGRPDDLEQWILHASPAWSKEHLEMAPEEVAEVLLRAFHDLLATLPGPARESPATPRFLQAHRWRYALAEEPASQQVLQSQKGPIYVAGDWLAKSRIEGAFLSGQAAAAALLYSLALHHRRLASSHPGRAERIFEVEGLQGRLNI